MGVGSIFGVPLDCTFFVSHFHPQPKKETCPKLAAKRAQIYSPTFPSNASCTCLPPRHQRGKSFHTSCWQKCIFRSDFGPFQLQLPETNMTPENRPGPKGKRSYSNHPFSGTVLVSRRVVHTLSTILMVEWNTTLHERKLRLEKHPFSTSRDCGRKSNP